jgi:biopolymer transport protein TolR
VPKVHAAGEAPAGRGRGRRVGTSLAEINVVPLVDVMLVLLIIFMVTAPMIQRGIDVKLPVARRATAVEGERLFVTVPASFRADGAIFLGDEKLPVEVLQERVRQKMETATDKRVYLRGDATVQLQDLMSIMSRLKDAGVVDVGIVAKAPGDR